MLIKELLELRESKMSDLHQEKMDALKAAIENEFGCGESMCERIADWLVNNTDDDEVQDYLYDQFEELHRGGDFDPSNAIADKMSSMFAKELKGL